MNILFVFVGALFSDPAPSVRVLGFGPDMTYLIRDTLTDIRVCPAVGRAAFVYATLNDTPGVGFANNDWTLAYSLDDDYGPLPYDPVYLTGALMISGRLGGFWPFLRLKGRLIAGKGYIPPEDYTYHEYKREFALSFMPGLSLAGERYDAAIWIGYNYSRDTSARDYHYGYPSIFREYSINRATGFRGQALCRFFAGANADWTLAMLVNCGPWSSWSRDSVFRIISGPYGDSVVIEVDEDEFSAFSIRLAPGVVREVRLGPDAACWVGFTNTWIWHFFDTRNNGEAHLSIPGAVELGLGPADKRLLIRAGVMAYQDINFGDTDSSFFEQPGIEIGYYGAGLRLYNRLRIEVAGKGFPFDDEYPDYLFELSYWF